MIGIKPEQIDGGLVQSVVAGTNVTVDATDPANPVISATGGGGGGGTVIKDRRWTPGPAETSIDEFNDDTLSAAWVRVDQSGTAGRVTWNEEADVLAPLNTGGDASAELHALVQPLSGIGGAMAIGDAFITAAALPAATSGNSFSGLILADGNTYGAGSQIAVTRHQSGQTYIRRFANCLSRCSERTPKDTTSSQKAVTKERSSFRTPT